MQRNFEFTLRLDVSESTGSTYDLIERLANAGVNDALVGIGVASRLALQFDREAESVGAAFQSAFADVQRATPEGKLIEAVFA